MQTMLRAGQEPPQKRVTVSSIDDIPMARPIRLTLNIINDQVQMLERVTVSIAEKLPLLSNAPEIISDMSERVSNHNAILPAQVDEQLENILARLENISSLLGYEYNFLEDKL